MLSKLIDYKRVIQKVKTYTPIAFLVRVCWRAGHQIKENRTLTIMMTRLAIVFCPEPSQPLLASVFLFLTCDLLSERFKHMQSVVLLTNFKKFGKKKFISNH
jgi:hypothetical protein